MNDVSVSEDVDPGFLRTEMANSLTHGIGLLLSIAGLVVLVVFAALSGHARHVVACSIYGSTMVVLYLASTLYHSARSPRAKHVLKVVDHAAIYLLIAGTYTPFTLITLGGGWGWSIFGVVWGLALVGIGLKIFFVHRFKILSVLVYLGMGWLSLLIIKPLLAHDGVGAIWWLLAGGLCYTVGVIFYLGKSIPHHHAIWHVFVMGGSACHFFGVLYCVILRT